MLSVRSCASLFVEKWECKGEHQRALKVRRVWGDDSTLCYRDIISISSSIFKDSFDWPARCVRVYPAPQKNSQKGLSQVSILSHAGNNGGKKRVEKGFDSAYVNSLV